MNFNIRLNIKSIIKTELFIHKPFNSIDYTNESDIYSLLYCIILSNNDSSFTFEEFKHLLGNKKLYKEMFSQFENECKVIGQFSEKGDNATENECKVANMPYIKDIVASLIIDSGLDANFIMNLSLPDLSIYIKAYDSKKREQMECSRLWTFLTCAPHIDIKKIRNARDFYPFPWELEEMKKQEKKNIERNEAELMKFLNQGMNYITGKNK